MKCAPSRSSRPSRWGDSSWSWPRACWRTLPCCLRALPPGVERSHGRNTSGGVPRSSRRPVCRRASWPTPRRLARRAPGRLSHAPRGDAENVLVRCRRVCPSAKRFSRVACEQCHEHCEAQSSWHAVGLLDCHARRSQRVRQPVDHRLRYHAEHGLGARDRRHRAWRRPWSTSRSALFFSSLTSRVT